MAQLFKKNIIKEKLVNFEILDFDEKIEVLKSWKSMQDNKTLAKSTEIELQWPFGEKFFSNILWYKNIWEKGYSMKFEPKVPVWGQKADIGLGFFWENIDKMKVVVELKDARISLDKPQQRAGNLTPVQQAFKYKPYFKECDFIIVSNFVEIRLYLDSYYDYEVWTIDELVDPKNNYFNFRKFYYLLCKKNLIKKTWDSNTKSLLSAIRIQEKEITKKFYWEYTVLRKELFKDIVKNNPWFKKSELDFLLNKTQKIIDRIIFIHFCEDLNLLPQWKLKEVIEYWEKSLSTTWETLQNFFRAVDSGSEKLWIPDWYNWGLFHTDEQLKKLKIWDEICKKFVDLWDYDFADDLSVNILWHIFEQSISDIEELKDKIRKQEEPTLSKRKKDWVFYTPEYIVDYIVKNSVGKKIDDWEEELTKKHNLKEDITDKNYTKRAISVYTELQEKVQNIKVLDPACGSGAFLVKVFDFLYDKNKEISKKLQDLWVNQWLFASESYFKTILQNNIFWVDLNEESVEITKLSLWLKTAIKWKKLANLDSNIKCWNSLIDDPEVAWDKAFNWKQEFPEIFQDWGFDIIVGNPPYVNIERLEKKDKNFLFNKYNSCKWRTDLYIAFIESNLLKLSKNGVLWYIIPYALVNQNYWKKLREMILKKYYINEIFDLSNYMVFGDAKVKSLILLISNKNNLNKTKISIVNSWKDFQSGNISNHYVNQESFFKLKEFKFETKNISFLFWIKKILEKNIVLFWDICFIAYWARLNHKKEKISKSFYISEEKKDFFKPFIEWKNIKRYYWKQLGWLNYKKEEHYNPMFKELFEFEKLMSINVISKKLRFNYDNNWFYNSHTIINCVKYDLLEKIDYKPLQRKLIKLWNTEKSKNFNIKFLLWILNSTLISWYFYNFLSDWLHFFPSDANQLPIKNIPLSEQKPFIEKADFMLENNKILQEKINKFLKRLNSNYPIEKLSTKLKNFFELDFSEFVKELKKKKVVLSLKEQDEWEEYFEEYKKEIVELKAKIDDCDKEIDEMVFELYGLDEEERRVVLDS